MFYKVKTLFWVADSLNNYVKSDYDTYIYPDHIVFVEIHKDHAAIKLLTQDNPIIISVERAKEIVEDK